MKCTRCSVLPAILFLAAACAFAQTPPVSDRLQPDPSIELERTIDAGAYREARFNLERALARAATPRERANILFAAINAAMRGEEYGEAYELTSAFLSENPLDRRRRQTIYDRGISAYHTGRLDTALASLNTFLALPSNNQRGEAYYWRGMSELERSQWELAEHDFESAYQDTISESRRDKALLGWALSLEHRGDIPGAAKLLEQLLNDYPHSDLVTDAHLRLASLVLQQGEPERALELLGNAHPRYRSQREETLLLHGEASLQRGSFETAQTDFQQFLSQYSNSPFIRNAQLGLAWSFLKKGDTPEARREFDSLGRAGDTLGLGALYQSGVLALLSGNTIDGMTTLGELTDRSPYDIYSDRAYYLMGLTEYRARHYREARKYFQTLTRLFPESPLRLEAYRMSGETGVALSDFSGAQYAFGQVRRLGAPADMLAPSMFQEGICLYHLGRFKSSAERFDEFLKKFPRDHNVTDACVWRGEALYQDGRYDEAEEMYRRALDRAPDAVKRSQAAYGIAWSLFEQKKFSQAAAAFERFAKDYPNSEHVLDASLRRADCYLFMREYDKASALYASLSAAKNSGRNTEYAAFQLAMSYIQRGETMRGIEQLREFLTRFPNSIYDEVVLFNIGWTYFSMEQYPQAITELRLLTRQFPESQLMPRVLFNLGDAFYNTKQYDSARAYYHQVVDRFPKSPLVKDAVSGLRFTFEAQGKSGEALETINQYIAADTVKGDTAMTQDLLMNKADILFGQGNMNAARDQYQKLLALKPENGIAARALQQLGHIGELKGDTMAAIGYYQRILREYGQTETAPAGALALGTAYGRTKHFNDAVQILRDFGTKYPASPLVVEAQYQLGLVYRNMSDKEKARSQFLTIIGQSPASVFADRSRMQIAKLDSDEKQYRRAIDTLEGIVSRRNDDIAAEALLMMGDCYMGLKKYVDALQSYKDVIKQYTDFPLLIERGHFGAGGAYERLRDRKLARQEYDAAIKSALDPAIKKQSEDRVRRLRR